MKSTPLILVFLLFQMSTLNLFGQEKEVVEINLDTSAILHWGQVSIPVSKIPTKGIEGKLISWSPLPPAYIPLNDLISSLKERIFLYQKNKEIYSDIKILTFAFKNSSNYVYKLIAKGVPIEEAKEQASANDFILKLTAKDLKKLSEVHIQKIINNVKHQTNLTIHINNRSYIGFAFIIDENAPYEAPAIVNQRPLILMDFQLLEPLVGPIILRIDTTSNKRFLNYYKNDGQTKIIHIPNFKTTNSTIDEKNEKDLEKILTLPSSYPSTETLTLPEYTDYLPKSLQLRLGQFMASPDGDNIPLASFKSKKGNLSLWQNKTQLNIKQFRLTIFDQENNAKTYWIKNLKNQKLQSHFDSLTYENAIYFDKIVIEKNKFEYYLGQPFLFKIGKAHLKK